MLWFVNISALAGLAAVAIPVAIHLLKSKRRTQTVPSLLLFTALRHPSRRRKLREILLLVVRALAVAALAMLLARPFLKWPGAFPRASDGRRVVLAIVVDDGLSSLLSINGRRCFDIARGRALTRLRALSEDSLVILSTATLGGCFRPMPVARAKAILERLEPFPVRGGLGESLTAVWNEVRRVEDVDYGAVAIFAPPVKSLWAEVGNQPPEARAFVAADDLGPGDVDPRITGLVRADGALFAELAGTPAALTRSEFQVKNPSGKTLHSERILVATALQGRIEIPAEIVASEGAFSVHVTPLASDVVSPLASFYHRIEMEADGSGRKRVLILYDDTDLSEIHAQIVYVALEATMSEDEGEIVFVNVASAEKTLFEGAGARAIVVCPLDDYAVVNNSLSDAVNEGGEALVFPPSGPAAAPLVGLKVADRPRFQGLTTFKESAPLTLVNQDGINPRLTKIYADGLSRARIDRCRPPLTTDSDAVLFTCADKPVIARRKLGDGAMTLCGLVLDGEATSLLGNPMFPQLAKTLVAALAGQAAPTAGKLDATVDVGEWLGVESGECVCERPDGVTERLAWSTDRRCSLTLDRAGFYQFFFAAGGGGERRLIRVVNWPRLTAETITADAVREVVDLNGRWLSRGDPIRYAPIPRGETKRSDLQGIIRDLTPPLAMALWLLLMIEMFLNALRTPGLKLGGEKRRSA